MKFISDEANEDGYGNGDSFVENLFANEISPSGGSCETSSEQIVLHKRAERAAHDNSNLSYAYYINPECLLLISYIFMRDPSFSIN